MIPEDWGAEELLMGSPPDVAPKPLGVLHIRLDLPET
jgi:hypothetical protein